MRLLTPYICCICLFFCCWVKAQPIANFIANRTSGCSPLTVQFTNQSTGNPTTFFWRFGNGNTSVIQNNVSATYVLPGTYTVTLIVSNASGIDSLVRTSYITVFANPVAAFTQSVSSGCAPLPVNFVNASTQGSAPITQYLWDFGDGTLSNSVSYNHTYATSGNRTVTLAVTDANGCQHAVTVSNAVVINQTQQINFTGNNLFNCTPPLSTTLSPTVTPIGTYSYLWTLSNGLTSTQPNPTFNFNTAGQVDVTLRVTNSAGCAETLTKFKYIQVVGVAANFVLKGGVACVLDSLTFLNTSVPDTNMANYTWRINGNVVNNNKHLQIPPLAQGNHQVELTIDALGCQSIKPVTITVHPKPTVAFNAQPGSICFVPVNVRFTNASSTGTGFSYRWTFGNNQTSNSYHDSTLFTNLVKHDVKLVVTNNFGCKDSLITAVQPLQPTVTIDKQHQKSGCKPYNSFFTLLPGQASQFTSFTWRYKNNIISTDSSFYYNFTDTGKHVVSLRLVSSNGCLTDLLDTVYVGMKVPVSFQANPVNGCYGGFNRIPLNGVENSGVAPIIYKWLWRGGSAEGKNTFSLFSDTGWFDVFFTANHYGCISDTSKQKLVYLKPAKAFFPTPIVNCSSDTLTFVNNSIGENRYKWFFNNTDSSTLIEPKYRFASTGNFQVTLVAFDTITSCVDTFISYVNIPPAPVIKINIKDSAGCPPLYPVFTNATVTGVNGINLVSSRWNINGKIIHDSLVHKDTFNIPGIYKIGLSITDSRGCTYMVQKDTGIWVSGGSAKIGLTANKGCVPFQMQAIDSSSINTPIASRKWVWGNGDSLINNNKITPYTYAAPTPVQGVGYTIRLRVTDIFGCSYETNKRVIPSKPKAKIDLHRNLSCQSQFISTDAPTSLADVYKTASYIWLYGHDTLRGATVGKTYTQVDTTIKIALTVIDSNGCIANADTVLHIKNKAPQIGFNASSTKLNCYKPIIPITLFDTSTIGSTPIVKWEWKTPVNTSNFKNPQLTFNTPGKFYVQLNITDSAGCVDSLMKQQYITIGGPLGSYTFSPKRGCTPNYVNFKTESPNAKYYIWDLADGTVDTVDTDTFSYRYTLPGIYYPRLTLVDSSGTCEFGSSTIDTITVYELPKPNFTASLSTICVNSSVVFTNTTPNQHEIVKWRWRINQRDSGQLAYPTFYFTASGVYDVSLTATDKNGCVDSLIKPAYIQVSDDTIPPAIPNVLYATVNSDSDISFNYKANQESDFDAYKIYYNYSGSTPHDSIMFHLKNDTSFNQSNINTISNLYQYSIASTDACKNISKRSIISRPVNLKAFSVKNGVDLSWSPYLGFDTILRYEIWRNNPDSGNSYTYIGSTTTASGYVDSFVTCFTRYQYKIKTIEQGGDRQYSWSNSSDATPDFVTTAPNTYILRATVTEQQRVLVQWQSRIHKLPITYVVYRKNVGEHSFSILKETSDTFIMDELVNVNQVSYIYVVYVKDACGGLGLPSNEAQTILLRAMLKSNSSQQFDPYVYFNHYQQWKIGVARYELSSINPTYQSVAHLTNLLPSDTFYFHEQVALNQRVFCYQVTAFEQDGFTQTSKSNIACVEINPTLYAPSAFTINNDGLNEKFEFKGIFIEQFSVSIYDRWGSLVFSSNDIDNSWDGTINGKPAPDGVYVYTAFGKDINQRVIKLNGNVTLLR